MGIKFKIDTVKTKKKGLELVQIIPDTKHTFGKTKLRRREKEEGKNSCKYIAWTTRYVPGPALCVGKGVGTKNIQHRKDF